MREPDREFAVLSDIHGNSWALAAVLEELNRRGITEIVNLGDLFYGPLDPAGTSEILRSFAWPTVRGNEDRILFEPEAHPRSPTEEFTVASLGAQGLEWLRKNTRAPFEWDGCLLCHGTPEVDTEYLLHSVTPQGTALRRPSGIDSILAGLSAEVVLCGHSHIPAVVRTGSGRLVVNPGSVGLQAYDDDTPHPHAMESGSPLASFAIVQNRGGKVTVEHVRVPYDVQSAAGRARENGRPDWADWLLTGFANP